MPYRAAFVAFLALLAFQPALRAEPSLERGTVLEAAARLEPGEFLWAPQVAPEGPVLVVINRRTQRLVVYRNGIPIGISTVSTGRPGYSTPTGIFTILQKRVEHYSSTYDNAPMPYMQRLTWRGVALHAGNLPGYPASHGCIRLPREFARLLYGVTQVGMTVVITDQLALPSVAPSPEVLAGTASRRPAAEGAIWNPQASPDGPVSVVVSSADARAIVLRNGRVIGSAPIRIVVPISATTAYQLTESPQSGRQWLRLPMPGQRIDPTAPLQLRGRIQVDEAFRTAVEQILQPGATVVVTPDSLRTSQAELPLRHLPVACSHIRLCDRVASSSRK